MVEGCKGGALLLHGTRFHNIEKHGFVGDGVGCKANVEEFGPSEVRASERSSSSLGGMCKFGNSEHLGSFFSGFIVFISPPDRLGLLDFKH